MSSDKSEGAPTIENLKSAVTAYYPEADVATLQKAYDFAVKLHGDQKRQSGEPYIIHPLSVSMILAQMRMDLPSILTGLLHDVVEDTHATQEQVATEFGQEVAQLVDGVTKLSKLNFKTSHEKQAENFRKMVMAMAKDLRVILVKLADRTHNMRTLEHLAQAKQSKIAQETLDIYAPLANRLGISWMKVELEDLSLRYTKPEIYSKLKELVSKKKKEREDYIGTVSRILTEKLGEVGLKANVIGRSKHFYSIYKKMEVKKLKFEEIHDLVGFRIMTQTLGECYEVLGVVHSFFKPVPGRFKDYIAMPKNNMYQSLHTTVIGPFGERMEIQIRTEDMQRVAESGIAAHWKYKEGKLVGKDFERFHWLRTLVEAQEDLKNPTEFLESVKLDLFAGDVYVFTPKGELIELPVGSTPVDFAYAVHTQVGHRCTGARINGRMVTLKHALRSGDTVEIVTSGTQKPSKDWLKFVKTGRAQARIRQFIRMEERQRALQIGMDLLDREFRRYDQALAKFTEKNKNLADLASKLGYPSWDELLISVGYGKTAADKLVPKIFPTLQPVQQTEKEKNRSLLSQIFSNARKQFSTSEKRTLIRVEGLDDVLVRFGRCCNPIPGDEIVGFISRGRGVTVHKLECKRALELDEKRRLDVTWAGEADRSARQARIRVVCSDEQGLLNEMSRCISARGVNIASLNIRVNNDGKAVGTFDLQVKNKEQLQACIRDLEALTGIISVERIQRG